jgi:hypothetical protein
MDMRKFFSVYLLAVTFLSCQPPKPDTSGNLTRIDVFDGYNHPGIIKLSEIVSDVEFVQLEAVPDSYFTAERWGFSQNVSISRNHILVVNAKGLLGNLLLFDRKGKFCRKIGRVGKGPGEFTSLVTACLDPYDRFVILVDAFGDRVIKYSLDGQVLKEKRFSEYSNHWEPDWLRIVSMDDEHVALLLSRPKKPMEGFSQVLVLDSDLNISNRLLPRANDDKLFLRGWVNAHLTAGSSSLLFWENYFDTLFYLNPDGKEKAKYQLWFSKDNLPEKYFNDRSGQTGWDQLCFIEKIVDLPKHLILLGNYNQEEGFGLAFDKETHQTVKVSDSVRTIFEYDLYQIPVFADFEVSYPEKILYQIVEIRHSAPKAPEKTAKKQARLTGKRAELAKVLENRTENDNPLLILMKLR